MDETAFQNALACAEQGWPVFPCNPETKAPLILGGFKKASVDPAQIKAWWRRYPRAMIGVPMGRASGVWALDIDAQKGEVDGRAEMARLELEHGALPPGPVARTPSGGRHHLFRYDADAPVTNSSGSLPRGIDVRGNGGYVCVAPSTRADGRAYEWEVPPEDADFPDAPAWLLDAISGQAKEITTEPAPALNSIPVSAPEEVTRTAPVITIEHPRLAAWVLSAIDQEITAVEQHPPGGRNNQLNKAAFALYQLVASEWLRDDDALGMLMEAAEKCGLLKDDGRRQVLKTIASGRLAGLAQPREVPADFVRDEELAQIGAEAARRLGQGAGKAPASSPSWDAPDLSVLSSTRHAPPPFNPEWLGPQLSKWATAQARATCAPVDYVATSLLALAGGILANRRRPLAGAAWSEPPIVFAGLVGDPSTNKSPASSAVMTLADAEEQHLAIGYAKRLEEHSKQKTIYDIAKKEWEGRVRDAVKGGTADIPVPDLEMTEPVEPRLGRVVVRDATTEKLAVIAAGNPGGFLLHRDELAGLLASFGRYSSGQGGSDKAFWLEAYGGRSFSVDRVKLNEPIRIPHLSIGIIGGIQPARLSGLLKDADDGFVARFLWCWPEPARGLKVARERFDSSAAQRAVNALAALPMQPQPVPQPDTPVPVPLDEAALQRLDDFRQWAEGRERDASPLLKSTLGKAPGHVLRLSCLLSFLWWAASSSNPMSQPHEIGETAVATAVEMMRDYFLPMAERVFGDAAVPEVDTNAVVLARHLAKEKLAEFNARSVRQKMGGPINEPGAMSAACAELEEACLIQRLEGASGKRGPKPMNFLVNPKLHQAWKGDCR